MALKREPNNAVKELEAPPGLPGDFYFAGPGGYGIMDAVRRVVSYYRTPERKGPDENIYPDDNRFSPLFYPCLHGIYTPS